MNALAQEELTRAGAAYAEAAGVYATVDERKRDRLCRNTHINSLSRNSFQQIMARITRNSHHGSGMRCRPRSTPRG